MPKHAKGLKHGKNLKFTKNVDICRRNSKLNILQQLVPFVLYRFILFIVGQLIKKQNIFLFSINCRPIYKHNSDSLLEAHDIDCENKWTVKSCVNCHVK